MAITCENCPLSLLCLAGAEFERRKCAFCSGHSLYRIDELGSWWMVYPNTTAFYKRLPHPRIKCASTQPPKAFVSEYGRHGRPSNVICKRCRQRMGYGPADYRQLDEAEVLGGV